MAFTKSFLFFLIAQMNRFFSIRAFNLIAKSTFSLQLKIYFIFVFAFKVFMNLNIKTISIQNLIASFFEILAFNSKLRNQLEDLRLLVMGNQFYLLTISTLVSLFIGAFCAIKCIFTIFARQYL